ncbi:hypothetical protein KC19_5G063100 [Ceratodon purpureus]|uniref:AP2/ERF domain-containing protein n=1 Tax=Ceratodon purpureus TaxID=3225 RepID=A0A8T0HZ98_CERPU|nr:hypothetical protein KC19_5G063100 [Ceratodon purpureus]
MVEKARPQSLNAKRGGNLLAPLKATPGGILKKATSSSFSPKSSVDATSGSPLSARAYKGVRMRTWGKWVSEIREPNKRSRIWLGSFPTAEMAAKAYDAAVVCLRGPLAPLNFPNCPPADLPQCTTPRDVQAAAAAAAAACAPPSSPSAETETETQTQTPSSENDITQSQQNSSSSFDDTTLQEIDTTLQEIDTTSNSHPSSTSRTMASDMEDWINAEFGSLEPLDEVRAFPELMLPIDFSSFSKTLAPPNFHDELPYPSSVTHSPSSDSEDSTLYDHNLWCFT